MNDRYTVTWSAGDRIIDIAMNGFWSDADVEAFSALVAQVVRQAGGRPFDLVADLSQLGAQSQNVVVLQTQVIAGLVAAGMKRLAIVGAGPLLSMQVKRAAAPLIAHFAGTAAEARSWLSQTT